MTIATVQLYRYTLPFTDSVAVGARSLTERRGLLLRLDGEEGAVGWGEAAPLPGFSAERLDEAAEALRTEARGLVGRDVSQERLTRRSSPPFADTPPSVQFAVDSAVLELRASARGVSVSRHLGGGSSRISVNALIGAEEKELEKKAKALRAEGYRAVKLKVGRGSVERDVRRVRTVDRAFGGDVQLRLDANRAWTDAEARSFAGQIDDVSVAYVEEPLANPEGIPRLVDDTALPVALDETTRERTPDELGDWGGVAAVVLKPTLLGGGTQVREWVESARDEGAAPVFSAAYESGVGMRMLVALASVYSDAPAGFSTYDRLGADVLTPRLPLHKSEIDADRVYDGTVDPSHLEEFASYD